MPEGFLFILFVFFLFKLKGKIDYYDNIDKIKKFKSEFREIDTAKYLLATVIWSFFIVVGLAYTSTIKPHEYVLPISIYIIIVSVFSLFLLNTEYKLHRFVDLFPKTTTLLATFAIFVVYSISDVIIDHEIVKYTHETADNFPHAQTLLKIIIVPVLWILLVYIILIPIVVGHILVILFSSLSYRSERINKYRVLIGYISGRYISRKRSLYIDFSIVFGIGVYFSYLVPLIAFSRADGTFETYAKEILYQSSYYSNEGICDLLQERHPEYLISLLNNNHASVAIPSDGGYSFATKRCNSR